jgi:chromosome segregation ATPase
MNWLRQHMQGDTTDSTSIKPRENLVRFRRDIPSLGESGTAALELVYQAADLIKFVESCAAGMEARAQALVRRAIEKLELAERRVHSAEAEREAAVAGANEASVRVYEGEKALERAEARISAVEAQLSTAELCRNEAETRASEAEKALVRIEDAIRIHLLGKRPDASPNLAAAA